MKERIYIYDFDGTLTRRDSLLDFIRYVRGERSLLFSLLLFSPLLVLMKLRLYSNGRTKERLFAYHFKGMSISEFDNHCAKYAFSHPDLLLDAARKAVNQVTTNGYRVFVVSASVDRWVSPFFRDMPDGHRHTNRSQKRFGHGPIQHSQLLRSRESAPYSGVVASSGTLRTHCARRQSGRQRNVRLCRSKLFSTV